MKYYYFLTITAILFISCQELVPPNEPMDTPKPINTSIPVVSTNAITDFKETQATGGGNVSSEGGSPVIARGVCWSTNYYPTIYDNKTINGMGSGNFNSSITGLAKNLKYYARAYASNNCGTGYGQVIELSTTTSVGGTETDIDGNLYHTIKIGSQTWMIENLKTTRFSNGDQIPSVTDDTYWTLLSSAWVSKPGYCNYNNNENHAATYGRLYNWCTVNDKRGIAPKGWHIPSRSEWQTLIDYLGGDSLAGAKLKEAGYQNWKNPNTGATNSSGFTALPGGYRSGNTGYFYELGSAGYWWTSTDNGIFGAISVELHNTTRIINKCANWEDYGFSVRCIKDY